MVEGLDQPMSSAAITSYVKPPVGADSLKPEGTYSSDTPAPIAKTIEFATPLQIPTRVFSTANRDKLNSIYDPRVRYRIFAAPTDPQECASYCFKGIGKSGTICLNKKCTTSHSGNLFEVPPGLILIKKKTKNKTFIEPIINSYKLHPSLFDKWLDEECTL